MKSLVMFCLMLSAAAPSIAAFTDSGQTNPQILRADSAIMEWASGTRDDQPGPVDYLNPGLGTASFGLAHDVLGAAGSPFSLGDGGSVVLTFDNPIWNGPGVDFAVFENGFAFDGLVYMELGFVEVSSDGVTFVRMPSICRRLTQTDSFEGNAPADFYNLAGEGADGTGFDLEDLITAEVPAVISGDVDLLNITQVRIVDVIGHIANGGASQDFFGTPVSDPYPTAFASGGMDLTGVAVLNAAGPVAVETATWGRVKTLYAR